MQERKENERKTSLVDTSARTCTTSTEGLYFLFVFLHSLYVVRVAWFVFGPGRRKRKTNEFASDVTDAVITSVHSSADSRAMSISRHVSVLL